jgi:hypothetical protein
MSFNDKVLLLPNARKLSGRQAEVDIDNAMALRAGKVVVVFAAITHAIVMGAIRKLDAGKQSPAHQLFNGAVDCRAAYTRLLLAEFLPQIFNGEICAAAFKIDQAFRDKFARARIALAQVVERCINFLCEHHALSFSRHHSPSSVLKKTISFP